MKYYQTLTEKLALSDSVSRLGETVRARLKGYAIEEGTFTGPAPTGEHPFLDAFEDMPDASYAQSLASAIVRSWLTAPVVIYDDDLLVGLPRPNLVLREHFSWGIQFDENLLNTEAAYIPRAEETRRRVDALRGRLFPMGMDHAMDESIRLLGADAHKASMQGLWELAGYQGHTVPGYPLLLSRGFGGTAEYIHRYMANTTDKKKLDLYQALLILLEGFRDYALLYADAADQKARVSGEPRFSRIAENCRAISWNKPATLYQAAQLMWFYSLFDWVDSIGRFDQYMYPFFEKACREGDIFPAEDIIAALYLKFQEHGVHNLGLGGVKPEDGSDATNELTFLVLHLARRFFGVHPRIQVRIHKNTPSELMRLIVVMWSEGMSDPTLVSDETVIPGLMAYGVMPSDARDYTTLGCQEIEIPGKSNFGCEDGTVNLAKIFEYTINNGCDRFSGVRVGLPTGYLTDHASMDSLWNAFMRQMDHFMQPMVDICNKGAEIRSANLAKLVKMLFTEDCIARGLDQDGGGAVYNYGVIETAGVSAVADSLAAIDSLVFRQKKLTMTQVKDAIDANFEGFESLRQQLLSAPKFGNDQPLPDEYAARILNAFWGSLKNYRSVRGGAYMGACSLLTRGIAMGLLTWALPDGRHTGEPLGNTIGPRTGADHDGLTAMLTSVMKLPLRLGVGGTSLNVLLPRDTLATPAAREKVVSLMTAYMLGGGQMAQITTATLSDMQDAQIHPERHKNLFVRVGGFSARFIEMDCATQKEIMQRYGA